MRMPNGYGSVSKLPGARRRPWRVRKTIGWEITPDGKTRQKTQNIGFYATKAEALAALAAFNADPYDFNGITFAEVYEKASERRFAKISASNQKKYRAAFALCKKLHDAKFTELKLAAYQQIVDASGKSANSLQPLKSMLQMMYDYAVQNDIVGREKDVIRYLDIGHRTKSNLHYRFNRSEIDTMWQWSENDSVKIMLMLIYCGCRPHELFELKTVDVDLKERVFRVRQGKTENAKRLVPIHHRTLPFFEHFAGMGREYLLNRLDGTPFDFKNQHSSYTETYWYPVLEAMGVLKYINDEGEEREHLPNDTRHTFTTMWTEQRLSEPFRRRIQGHSGKGIGEQVYTHLDIAELRDELDKLI